MTAVHTLIKASLTVLIKATLFYYVAVYDQGTTENTEPEKKCRKAGQVEKRTGRRPEDVSQESSHLHLSSMSLPNAGS